VKRSGRFDSPVVPNRQYGAHLQVASMLRPVGFVRRIERMHNDLLATEYSPPKSFGKRHDPSRSLPLGDHRGRRKPVMRFMQRPYHDRAQRRRSRTAVRRQRPLGGHSTVLVTQQLGSRALGRSAGSTRVHRWVCGRLSENCPTKQFCFARHS
jgi:hypothetical protein